MTPLLSVEDFREELGYPPWHFWGLSHPTYAPVDSACNGLVFKYAWQDAQAAGRTDIESAIETAESRLQEYLGYSVAPHYASREVPWPRYGDPRQWRYGASADPTGRHIAVRLPEGNVLDTGIEQFTYVGQVTVTYHDFDNDGLPETFTTTALATTEIDPKIFSAYFIVSDRLYGEISISEAWRIRPIQVMIGGGTVHFRGRSWLLVKPVKQEGQEMQPLDPLVAANFVTTLDIYTHRTYRDGETVDDSQGVLLWETIPCGGDPCICGGCNGVTTSPATSEHDPAAVGYTVARVGIRDTPVGMVLPAQAVRDPFSGIWYHVNWSVYREPDRVRVRYLAGYPWGNDNRMDKKWRTVVARLAAAEMGRSINACDKANRELYHWQFDLARAAGANDEQYRIGDQDLNNPFGTLRGQVYAWKQVRNQRLQTGISTAL